VTENRKAARKHFLGFALMYLSSWSFKPRPFICLVYQVSRIIPEKTCAFQTVPVSSVANFGQQDAWTVRYVTQLRVREHRTTTVSGMFSTKKTSQ